MMRILLFAIFMLCWAARPACAMLINTKDSLLRAYMTSAPDRKRLETLHELTKLHQQAGPTFLYYENLLLQEAIRQKDLKYQSKSIYEHIVYHHNGIDLKRVEMWMCRMETFAAQNNYYADYFNSKRLLIESYNTNQQIELAIRKAEEMMTAAKEQNNHSGMREAALCLAASYAASMRNEACKEQLDLANAMVKETDPLVDQINAYAKIASLYQLLQLSEKQKEALDSLAIAKQKLEEATPYFKEAASSLSLFLNSGYAIYYLRQQQQELALDYLQHASKYAADLPYPQYRAIFYQAYAVYYQETANYQQALKYIDKAIEMAALYSAYDVIGCKARKANILTNMGQPADAIPIYQQALQEKDSLYHTLLTMQMEQIRGLYEIDRLTQEKEKQNERINYTVLIVILIAIFSLIVFVIHLYLNRQKMQKNQKEVQQLTQIAEETNEIKNLFLANMSYSIRIPLNNVVGFSQLLSTDSELSEKERNEYSTIIQANSAELIQQVNDVLDLSRLEANMMKFQLQNYNLQEWYNDLSGNVNMQSEGVVQLQLTADIIDAEIYTDLNRLTQIILGMTLYPDKCNIPRVVEMKLTYRKEQNILQGEIENSPLVDPAFASQKTTIRQKIGQLFFEHFEGTYRVEKRKEAGIPTIVFTYPTLP